MVYEKYISLSLLAQETGLPKALLKRYAQSGEIPSIKNSKKLMFKPSDVQAALDRIAKSGGKQ